LDFRGFFSWQWHTFYNIWPSRRNFLDILEEKVQKITIMAFLNIYLKLPFKLHIFTFFSINNIYMDFVQFNFT